MQARSGALDELLESGVLEDVGGGTDDIQKELDQVGKDAQVDNELAALKAQLGTGAPPEPDALRLPRRSRTDGGPSSGGPGGGQAGPVVRRGACSPRTAPRRRPAAGPRSSWRKCPAPSMVTWACPVAPGTCACSTSAHPRVAGSPSENAVRNGTVERRPARAACAGSGARTRSRA